MISNERVKHVFSGNGASKKFQIPFDFFQNTAGVFDKNNQISVILTDATGTETTLVEDIDYEVETHDPSDSGSSGYSGYVTLNTAPAVGEKLTIMRDVPLVQELDLEAGQEIGPVELEAALDKVVMTLQQLNEKLGRAICYKPSTTDGQIDADAYLANLQALFTEGSANITAAAADAVNACQSYANTASTKAAQAAASFEDTVNRMSTAIGAANTAVGAQNTAIEAKNTAVSAKTEAAAAANTAQASAASAAAALEDIKKLKREMKSCVVGTPSGAYDGSLTEFDTGVDLTSADVVTFVNGQRKDDGEYSVSGQKVVFAYSLTAGDVVVLEINSIIRTAETADVDAAISAHNTSAGAHPSLQTGLSSLGSRVSALENSSGGSGGAEQSVVAFSSSAASSFFNSAQKNNFRSSNLGISGKTITRVEFILGTGAEGSPRMVFPCLTGWDNQSGNFVTVYYQWPAGNWVFANWFTDTSSIYYEIRVYYK